LQKQKAKEGNIAKNENEFFLHYWFFMTQMHGTLILEH
jgi:hypothetical protein